MWWIQIEMGKKKTYESDLIMVKIRDWNLSDDEYRAILEYSWKSHLPIGHRISDDEIRSVIGRDKKLYKVI